MFGWRRRSEGFEWREYVRTTVLVRRRDRQKRVDDAMLAARAKAHEAKDRGVEAGRVGLNFAGEQAAHLGRRAGRSAAAAARLALSGLTLFAASLAQHIPERLRAGPDRPVAPSARPAGAGPAAARQMPRLMPDVARRLPVKPQHVMYASAALAVIYFGGPVLRGEGMVPDLAADISGTAFAPAASLEPTEFSGRAVAVAGDSLRIKGTLVRLAGIDAPEPGQPCFKANGRRWSCGSSARSALARIVRGQRLTCLPAGEDETGRQRATCRAGSIDVAEVLVRSGHVFAASGVVAPYTSAEDEARAQAAGIWQGEAVRPAEWRERAWEEAKRAAPDGCPIKGIVRASSRTYQMPWFEGYDGARPRPERGDRWFCSEDEAREAGFLRAGGA